MPGSGAIMYCTPGVRGAQCGPALHGQMSESAQSAVRLSRDFMPDWLGPFAAGVVVTIVILGLWGWWLEEAEKEQKSICRYCNKPRPGPFCVSCGAPADA